MHKRHGLTIMTCSVIFAVSLSGCAQYRWQKYGATQSDFNRDVYECQTEAAKTYPTQVVTQQVTSGYTTPSTTHCYGSGSAYGNSDYAYGNSTVNCTTMPGEHVPGVTATVDANGENRSLAAKQCMYARGWQLIQVTSSSQALEPQVPQPHSQDFACAVNSDCLSGYSCRSRKGGGTECRSNYQVLQPHSQEMACAANSDCPNGSSCRSKKGGGTECRPN